jgi:N-acetylglucosaminyldiphosphoundecaprenol N-acetyl-beta-D-mannosaminyltransferase
MNIPQVPILGVQISAINMELALAQIEIWVSERSARYVCVAPAHSIMECVNDPSLLPVFNEAGMVTPDGMAVVWLLRLKGHKEVRRVYGPDLLLAACAYGLERGWQHHFLGGSPETLALLTADLRARFPGLQIAGQTCPPFHSLSAQDDEDITAAVNASQADILWVGLGSPRQEAWMNRELEKIKAPVMVGVGAAFDFLSGRKAQAPLWVQRIGMEWLFRLANEPKRLWPRYRQYPKFVLLVLFQHLGLIHFSEKLEKKDKV